MQRHQEHDQPFENRSRKIWKKPALARLDKALTQGGAGAGPETTVSKKS